MLEKIDINNFGNYVNFSWNKEVRDQVGNNIISFKKLNIIYGRNYSGKTTLSKIFRSLENRYLPNKFDNPSFTFTTTDKTKITEATIANHDYDIRVYNKDFLDEHLSFLRDENGHIKPFAILGGENTLIESSIDSNEKKLGSVEQKTGLRYEYKENFDILSRLRKSHDDKKKKLDDILFEKANGKYGIKHNSIYKNPIYDKNKLISDIFVVISKKINSISDEERVEYITKLNEKALPLINFQIPTITNISHVIEKTKLLLNQEIKPTHAIIELLNNDVLQNWVRHGLEIHQESRDTCGFCGNVLRKETLDKIKDHFNVASKALENDLKKQISNIDQAKKEISIISLPSPLSFYQVHQEEYQSLLEDFQENKTLYIEACNLTKEILQLKLNNIFGKVTIFDQNPNLNAIDQTLTSISKLVNSHNAISNKPELEKSEIIKILRLSEISKFINDIDYEKSIKEIETAKKEVNNQEEILKDIKLKGEEVAKEIETLKSKLLDEKKGAEKVNYYLCHSLSGESLKLIAAEGEHVNSYKFKITRDGKEAFNLSEGECSLIAFCYFLAKLDEASESINKKIIYIDDPISSLDSNHIFFIYSLIEKYLAQSIEIGKNTHTNVYEQMFISTHNLEFLKYLKRISSPENGKKESFVILRQGKGNSCIRVMPKYLRNYITELNYLFGEIYSCSKAENFTKEHHSFYNFGNNLRKFLEAYLFFKYPSQVDDRNFNRVSEFFKDGTSSSVLVERLINEYSHVGEFIDRSSQPIDSEEITTLANFVLKKMRDNDGSQFTHFLKSIDQPDPFTDN